jgi:hypothetical protein
MNCPLSLLQQESTAPPVIIIDNLHDLLSPYLLQEQSSASNLPPSLQLESLISRITIHLRYLLGHCLSSAILLLHSLSMPPPPSSLHSPREISSFLTKTLPFWSILSDSVDLSVFAHRSQSSSPHPTEANDWIYEEKILFESDVNTPNLFDAPPDDVNTHTPASSIGNHLPTDRSSHSNQFLFH